MTLMKQLVHATGANKAQQKKKKSKTKANSNIPLPTRYFPGLSSRKKVREGKLWTKEGNRTAVKLEPNKRLNLSTSQRH